MPISRRSRAVSSTSVRLVPDPDLKQRIEAHLPSSGNGGSNVSCEVRNGFVTLRGEVRTFREKERIHHFVMSARGVRALKDLIKVEPAESLADRQVALLVRQALDAHSELPPGTATVHIQEGVCTLKGYVRTAEERHVAQNVASHCRGVKRVNNQLAVDPLDEVSDEATVHAVKSALTYCTEFDIEKITVSCVDGRVILRGMVPSIMERSLAEEVTRIQNGVRSVENHIQVATHVSLDPVTVADNARRRQSRRASKPAVKQSVRR